jgi:rhodanese-related sulfurtransferase
LTRGGNVDGEGESGDLGSNRIGGTPMPHELHQRTEVQALIRRGIQVVEVLAPEEFEEDHLPGAINIPLSKLETEAGRVLDRSRPVLVYCWDSA